MNKEKDSTYKYSYQDNPSVGLLQNVIDSNPLTYFEYETISIKKADRLSKGAKDYEFNYSYEETSGSSKSIKYKSWADHDELDPLRLVLSIKADKPQKTNTLSIIPFLGTDQISSSVLKVSRVVAIDTNSQEIDLINEPIYIGFSVIPTTIEESKNYFYDKAKIVFEEITTSDIQIYFEQYDSKDIAVKHMFWKPIPSTGRLSALNTQTRFDPSVLGSIGFNDVQYNQYDLIPKIDRPNAFKDESNLSVKQINVTYRDQQKADTFALVFKRTSNSSLVKHYYTNSFTGFESLSTQQEKAASLQIDFAWRAESKEAAERIKAYVESKILSGEWLSSNFQDLSIETIKATFNPKTYTATINLKKDYEVYSAKRFAIGLRSIDIGYQHYASSASFVSNTYEFPYNVRQLTLSLDSRADYSLVGQNESLIKTYVSLDDGKNWIRLSPIENPFIGIPEILSFNEFIEGAAKVKGVGYFNYPSIPAQTKRIKIKIEMFKPKYANATPVIYSYKLTGKVEQT